jgi:hypothetical protein
VVLALNPLTRTSWASVRKAAGLGVAFNAKARAARGGPSWAGQVHRNLGEPAAADNDRAIRVRFRVVAGAEWVV